MDGILAHAPLDTMKRRSDAARFDSRPRSGRLGLAIAMAGALLAVLATPVAAAIPSGNQLMLDGVDDYAYAEDDSSLDLGGAGADFTIEAFIHVPAETSDQWRWIFYKDGAHGLAVNTARPAMGSG